MKMPFFALSLAIFSPVPFSAAAAGTQETSGENATADAGSWRFPVEISTRWRVPANNKNFPGKMGAWEIGTGVSAQRIANGSVFSGSISHRYTDYDFGGIAPFSNTENLRLSAHFEQPLSPQWGAFVNSVVSFTAETNAKFFNGAAGRLGGGIRYVVSPDLIFYGGGFVITRLEEGASWLPYLGVQWKINPHWSFSLTNGAVVTYDVFGDETLRLNAGVTYELSSFRLVNSAIVGKRAVEIREVPVTLGLTQELGKGAFLRLQTGVIVFNKYKFRSDGEVLGAFKTDVTATFSAEFGMRF